MRDTIDELLKQATAVWKYRWHAVAACWIAAVGGWIFVYLMPNQYEAKAQIYVDTDTILRPLLKGLTVESTDVAERLALMSRVLLGRPNLEKVAKSAGLTEMARTRQEHNAVLDKLAKDIQLTATYAAQNGSRKAANVYEITVRHGSPETAERIVRTLLDTLMESLLGDTRREADVAQSFLGQQIAEYEKKLLNAENRLREFKLRHIEVLASSGEGYMQRLQAAQNALDQVMLEIREAEQRRTALVRQLESTKGGGTVFSATGVPLRSPLEERIAALQGKLDEMLLRYTDEHPAVKELKDTLAELERKRRNERHARSDGSSESDEATNPVYRQVKLTLGEVEAQLASMRVRQAEYTRRVAALKQQVETVPGIEAELQRLNRDYEINKENYNKLVASRESARMAENVQQAGENVKFRIVDPPRAPRAPVAPKRLLLSTGVLFAALGLGVLAAFLLAQIRPAVYDRSTLQQLTGLPVFGSISMVLTPAAQSRRRIEVMGLAASVGALLVVYGGVMFLQFTEATPVI